MITDPNCNDPLDFTMPDCDDEVVKGEFKYQIPADCEADTINYGRYYTPDYSDEYAYSYNTADKKCSKACRPKTCQELSGEFIYKNTNEQGLENQQFCPTSTKQVVDTSPNSKYPYGNCYKQCTCDTSYYKYPTEYCDSSFNELNGETCTNPDGEIHYTDCTPDCRNTSDIEVAKHKFTAGTCPDPLLRSGKYEKTTVNNECWTTCGCPDNSSATPPACASPLVPVGTEVKSYQENGTSGNSITCSIYECNCPKDWVDERDICPNGETTEFSGGTCTQEDITYREKRMCTPACTYKYAKDSDCLEIEDFIPQVSSQGPKTAIFYGTIDTSSQSCTKPDGITYYERCKYDYPSGGGGSGGGSTRCSGTTYTMPKEDCDPPCDQCNDYDCCKHQIAVPYNRHEESETVCSGSRDFGPCLGYCHGTQIGDKCCGRCDTTRADCRRGQVWDAQSQKCVTDQNDVDYSPGL